MAFTDAPLEALRDISAAHQPITKQDLEKLKQQIDVALGIPDSEMRLLTYSEQADGIRKHGAGSVCVGEFVIKRR